MMESSHIGFIVAAYAVAAATVVGMILAILADHRGLTGALRRLEEARRNKESEP